MNKEPTKGRKNSKEILRTTSYDRYAFYLNTCFSHSKVWIFFSKKLGQLGDGKRKILLGWPFNGLALEACSRQLNILPEIKLRLNHFQLQNTLRPVTEIPLQ